MGGDLIIRVGEHEVGQSAEIHDSLQGLKSGQEVGYTFIRGGKVYETTVTVDEVITIPKLAPLKKSGRR